MPLPSDPNQPWPPKTWAPIQRDIEEAAAWYSGDEARLTAIYGGPVKADGQPRGFSRFWSRRSLDQPTSRQRLHVPAAADVAATSADLLFGHAPGLTIPEAHEETKDADAVTAEERLAEIAEADGWASTFLEGAEVCAALGGVYLRPVWDPSLADHPMITVVHCDHAVPEFRWGKLVAVTFWREVHRDETAVWRHLERHEPGVILHGLYVGDRDHLGTKRALADHDDTAALAVDTDGAVTLPAEITGLDVRYVPNVLPNRKHRGRPIGRSDTAGTEALMDALDETWSSWMRDIRLAKARVIVPKEFLEHRGRGLGAGFDLDQEVFSPLEMDPSSQDKAGITLSQFEIRTEEHARTCMELFQRIVVTAGYSPQTFGMHGDGADQTATEVDARTDRSERTTDRKRRYWASAVEDEGEIVLILDRAIFGTDVVPMRPRIKWGDEAETDIAELGRTLADIRQAQAASTRVRVKILHPDWDDTEVDAEAKLILEEEGLAVADPTGGFPA